MKNRMFLMMIGLFVSSLYANENTEWVLPAHPNQEISCCAVSVGLGVKFYTQCITVQHSSFDVLDYSTICFDGDSTSTDYEISPEPTPEYRGYYSIENGNAIFALVNDSPSNIDFWSCWMEGYWPNGSRSEGPCLIY